jgi:hypothetical protein
MPKVIAKFRFKLLGQIRMIGTVSPDFATMNVDDDLVRVLPPAIFDDEKYQPKWSVTQEEATGSQNGELKWNADVAIIEVEGEVKSTIIEKGEEGRLLHSATEGLKKLLEVYRWHSRQSQIIVAGEELYKDYHVSYFDSKGNRAETWRGDSMKGTLSMTVFGGEESSSKIWSEVQRDITSGVHPELWQNLIMDAYQAVSTDPSSAVVKAGAACENFIERFCNSLSDKQQVSQDVYKALTSRERIFPEYFHIILLYLLGRSLKNENSDLYTKIENLYKTANTVRHEGLCQYNDTGGRLVTVNSEVARQMIKSIEDAIKWAKSLISC